MTIAKWLTTAFVLCPVVTVAGPGFPDTSEKPAKQQPGPERLTVTEFDRLHSRLTKMSTEKVWSIPWQLSVREARERAARDNKPVFLWISSNGGTHPLGPCWGSAGFGRVTVFNDPEIVRLLSTKCIPVATTVRDAKRQDADGEFFRKVTKSIPYSQSGACVFTPDGRMLGAGGATDKEGVLPLIQEALKKFKAPSKPCVLEPPGKVDEKNHEIIQPPQGALVVNCIMTYLAEPKESVHPRLVKLIPQTVGVDRLWIPPDEARALVDGKFPASLKRRMARWHLIDNRNFNRNADDCIKKCDIELTRGQLSGSFRTQFDSESPEGKKVLMELELLGFIESRGGKLTRFDLVGKGRRVAGNSLEPYPVAFAFTLADEKHVAFRIPPYPVLAYSESVYFRD